MELSTIKEGLRKDKQYFFTIHETDKTGEVRLKRYSYIYIAERTPGKNVPLIQALESFH